MSMLGVEIGYKRVLMCSNRKLAVKEHRYLSRGLNGSRESV